MYTHAIVLQVVPLLVVQNVRLQECFREELDTSFYYLNHFGVRTMFPYI
jgi:hypothetical protein